MIVSKLNLEYYIMKDDLQKEFVDLGNVRLSDVDMKSWYEEIDAKGIDPFSPEHFRETHTNPILIESEHWVFTRNAIPYSGCKEHFLLVSKDFVKKISGISPESWVDFQNIIETAEDEYGLDGHVLFMRLGDTRKTGASVVRLHAHLIVPKDNDDSGRTAIFPIVVNK